MQKRAGDWESTATATASNSGVYKIGGGLGGDGWDGDGSNGMSGDLFSVHPFEQYNRNAKPTEFMILNVILPRGYIIYVRTYMRKRF